MTFKFNKRLFNSLLNTWLSPKSHKTNNRFTIGGIFTYSLMWLGSPFCFFLAFLAAMIIPMTMKSDD